MTSDPAVLALAALALHLVSFLVLALAAPLRRAGRPAAGFSILCAAGSLAAALMAWSGHGETASTLSVQWIPQADGTLATLGVVADADSTIMLCLVALVALLVQIYSFGYLHDEPRQGLGRYYTWQALFAFSMMGLVLAPNFLQLFICWELVGLCSYLLIGYWYYKPEAAQAALKAFWITKAGDVGFLIGIVMLWRHTGTFEFADMRAMAEAGAIAAAGLPLITFCLYLGAMGKSAQFPLHIWLPDAMEGPTPVSALIHAATMVTAGVYMLHRTSWLFALTPEVLAIVAWIGGITALMAAILACVQDDIKRVLAYSTVSQLGFMMTAIGAGFPAAGFFHLLTHGIFKALLFLGAGAVIHAVHSNDLQHMGGLARKMPQTMIVFVIGTLSLAGIPLFGGFLSKEEILGGVYAGAFTGPFLLLVASAFLTAFYMLRVVFLAFFAGVPAVVDLPAKAGSHVHEPAGTHVHEPAGSHVHDGAGSHSTWLPPSGGRADIHAPSGRTDAHGTAQAHAEPHDPPLSMLLPLWVLALLSLGIGLYFTVAPHAEPAFESPGWLMPVAVAVAVAGIALSWLAYQRRAIDAERLAAAFGPIRHAAIRRFWIDDLFAAAYERVLLGFSRMVGWLDRYLVDGVLNVVSAWTLDAGDDLRKLQSGRAQDYVYGIAVGLLVLILWMGIA